MQVIYATNMLAVADLRDRIWCHCCLPSAAAVCIVVLSGKTTLMDVIAGRKTMGKITGDILVNGRPKDTKSFNNLSGYVEQEVHQTGSSSLASYSVPSNFICSLKLLICALLVELAHGTAHHQRGLGFLC